MTDAERLDAFIDRYTPSLARQGQEALTKLRALLPGAVEMVYDNYTGLTVSFGSTERASDAVIALVFGPRWLRLSFLYGKTLDAPPKLLKDDTNEVRWLKLGKPKGLDDPEVQDLIAQAVAARGGWDRTRHSEFVIKSVSAKQQPRRP